MIWNLYSPFWFKIAGQTENNGKNKFPMFYKFFLYSTLRSFQKKNDWNTEIKMPIINRMFLNL